VKHDWNHPLPFGDSYFVNKKDVEPLTIAVRRLLDNIYEFGAPTDEEIVETVEEALQGLLASCADGHQGPIMRGVGGRATCVTCRRYVDLDDHGKGTE
jgi:hypothetical protein